jgi:hypothetical protein
MRLGALAAVGLTACAPDPHLHTQTKSVTATNPPPEVMLLVDASTQMAPQFDELRSALSEMLSVAGEKFLWGLTVFPGAPNATCTGDAAAALAPIPAAEDGATRVSQSADVITRLASVAAGGARRPAFALQQVQFKDPTRDHLIMLITSGDDECGAFVSSALGTRPPSEPLLVIGFGPSASHFDSWVKVAGASCPNGTDAECGADNPCTKGLGGACTHPSYLARNGAELMPALMGIVAPFTDSICAYTLETPASGIDRVQVYINHVHTPPGDDTWSLSEQRIIFLGEVCRELRDSTTRAPVFVEVVVDDRL